MRLVVLLLVGGTAVALRAAGADWLADLAAMAYLAAVTASWHPPQLS
jgi:hypothetical protein